MDLIVTPAPTRQSHITSLRRRLLVKSCFIHQCRHVIVNAFEGESVNLKGLLEATPLLKTDWTKEVWVETNAELRKNNTDSMRTPCARWNFKDNSTLKSFHTATHSFLRNFYSCKQTYFSDTTQNVTFNTLVFDLLSSIVAALELSSCKAPEVWDSFKVLKCFRVDLSFKIWTELNHLLFSKGALTGHSTSHILMAAPHAFYEEVLKLFPAHVYRLGTTKKQKKHCTVKLMRTNRTSHTVTFVFFLQPFKDSL